MTPEERITQELAFIKPPFPAWKNSDGSYSILLPRTHFNGWMWWFKYQHGALLNKTTLQTDFKLRKMTSTRRGVYLCFEDRTEAHV